MDELERRTIAEAARLRRKRLSPRRLRLRPAALGAVGYDLLARPPRLLFAVGGTGLHGLRRSPDAAWRVHAVTDPASPLLALVEDVRRRLGAPPVDEVVLSTLPTAALREEVSGLRVHRRALLLGTALFEALDVPQLRAVIAHELAHGRRPSGLLDRAIWRTAAEWEDRHTVRRSTPKLLGTAVALAPARERDADRRAAAATGARTLAQALLRLSLLGPFLADLPAANEAAGLAGRFAVFVTSDDAREILLAALEDEGSPLDGHPPLAERLSALGMDEPFAIDPIVVCAAVELELREELQRVEPDVEPFGPDRGLAGPEPGPSSSRRLSLRTE